MSTPICSTSYQNILFQNPFQVLANRADLPFLLPFIHTTYFTLIKKFTGNLGLEEAEVSANF